MEPWKRPTGISCLGISASVDYNVLRRRISRTVNSVTTTYVYDGWDIIQETVIGGPTTNYTRTLSIAENGVVSGQISKEKLLLDTKETSAMLGVSRNTLYDWVVHIKIPHVKVGRLVKFRKADLDDWLKKKDPA